MSEWRSAPRDDDDAAQVDMLSSIIELHPHPNFMSLSHLGHGRIFCTTCDETFAEWDEPYEEVQ